MVEFAVKYYGENEEGFPEDYPQKVYKLKKGARLLEGYEVLSYEDFLALMTYHADFRRKFIENKKLSPAKSKKIMQLKDYVNDLANELMLGTYPENIQKSFGMKVLEAEEYLSLKRDKEDCYILYEEAIEIYNTEKPSGAQMVQLCERIIRKANGEGNYFGFKRLIGRLSGRYKKVVKEILDLSSLKDIRQFDFTKRFEDINEDLFQDD